jgi:hypothetical protein
MKTFFVVVFFVVADFFCKTVKATEFCPSGWVSPLVSISPELVISSSNLECSDCIPNRLALNLLISLR